MFKRKQKEDHHNLNLDFEGQHEDEEVLKVFRRHPVVMRKGLIAVLLGLLVGMIPSLIWPLDLFNLIYAPAGMLLGSIVFFYYWIGWYYSVFIVTDQRLIQITQKGFFSRTVADIGLMKIQSINYQVAGVQETILGFGTILVQTFVGDMVLDKIHKPAIVSEELSKIIKELGFTALGETPVEE